MPELVDPAKRVVLITGASRGLGRALAEAFAGPASHLVLVARTAGALEEADDRVQAAGGSATLVPLDLRAADGIERLGAALAERWRRLDVLIACAGELGPLTPVSHLESKALERVLTLEVKANHRLIRTMEPLLRAAPAGRAVFTTAAQARDRRPFFGAYAAAKAGLEALVLAWAAETRKTPVRVNLVEAPAMPTRLRESGFPGEDRTRLTPPSQVVPLFLELADPGCSRHGEIVPFPG